MTEYISIVTQWHMVLTQQWKPFDRRVLGPGFELKLGLEERHAVVGLLVDVRQLLQVLFVEAQQLAEMERRLGEMGRGHLPLISVDEACCVSESEDLEY